MPMQVVILKKYKELKTRKCSKCFIEFEIPRRWINYPPLFIVCNSCINKINTQREIIAPSESVKQIWKERENMPIDVNELKEMSKESYGKTFGTRSSKVRETVLEYLRSNSGTAFTQTELEKATGIKKSGISRVLKEQTEAGTVQKYERHFWVE